MVTIVSSSASGKKSGGMARAVLVSIVAILCAVLGLDYTGILGGI